MHVVETSPNLQTMVSIVFFITNVRMFNETVMVFSVFLSFTFGVAINCFFSRNCSRIKAKFLAF